VSHHILLMARRYGPQPADPGSRRYAENSDGPNEYRNRIRNRTGSQIGSRSVSVVSGSDEAATRRWRELRVRLRVARSLRYSSQSRAPSTRQMSWGAQTSLRYTANRPDLSQRCQVTRQPQTTRLETTAVPRKSASTRSRFTRTSEWWKPDEGDDRTNRNDPVSVESDQRPLVNGKLQHREPSEPPSRGATGHVDNYFRFADADRELTNSEPSRYVDGNISRCVRSCRRWRSFDEEDSNSDRVAAPFPNTFRSRVAANRKYAESGRSTREMEYRCSSEVERLRLSTLKRSWSHSLGDSEIQGICNDEQMKAVDDLLSLDKDYEQSVDVDIDLAESNPDYFHDCNNSEFQAISNELRHLCLNYDQSVGADGTSDVDSQRELVEKVFFCFIFTV